MGKSITAFNAVVNIMLTRRIAIKSTELLLSMAYLAVGELAELRCELYVVHAESLLTVTKIKTKTLIVYHVKTNAT